MVYVFNRIKQKGELMKRNEENIKVGDIALIAGEKDKKEFTLENYTFTIPATSYKKVDEGFISDYVITHVSYGLFEAEHPMKTLDALKNKYEKTIYGQLKFAPENRVLYGAPNIKSVLNKKEKILSATGSCMYIRLK